jgi:DsbC/DsbD-like thiol-disulfide interchange protein
MTSGNWMIAGAALAVVCALPANAQERPVIWTASASPGAVAPGATTTIQLKARIDQGWHVYSISQGPGGPIPTRIALAPGQPFELIGTVRGPAPETRFDSNFGINVETYDDLANFALTVRVAADARPGTDTLAIKARFQTCNASLCLPPHTETVLLPVTVARAAKSSAKAAVTPVTTSARAAI